MTDFKKWLITALILAVGLVYGGMMADQSAGRVAVQKQELLDRTSAINSLRDLKADFGRSVPILSDLEKTLTTKDDLAGLVPNWEKLAKNSSVSFSFDFSADTPPTVAEPGFTAFHLVTAGSYSNIVKFLKAVGSSGYFVRLVDLETKEGSRGFEASVNGQVFYR
ncbi:MAG: hypothetical protein Q8P76_03755 [bacterium]|nr:hypothetical protein [bacterium]